MPHEPQALPGIPQMGRVVVVVVVGVAGAQSSLAPFGMKLRLPNWSVRSTVGRASLGHLTL